MKRIFLKLERFLSRVNVLIQLAVISAVIPYVIPDSWYPTHFDLSAKYIVSVGIFILSLWCFVCRMLGTLEFGFIRTESLEDRIYFQELQDFADSSEAMNCWWVWSISGYRKLRDRLK